MAQTLEAIRGGGGSIKVGTTGKISALMSREIESIKPISEAPSFCTSVSISASDETSRSLKPKTSADEASSSSSSSTGSFKNQKGPENLRRKHHIGTDISVDGTPIRKKPVKKRLAIVEIVDIKCGNPDKTWVNPITHRLKKLGLSKLSDSVV